MVYSDFKRQLNDGEYFSVYLLEGEDAFFRKLALNDLINTFVSEKDLNFVAYDGASLELDSLKASLYLLPFMSKRRVTFISEFYPDKSKLSAIKDFLENPPSDSVFVISNQASCDSLKKFESVKVVDCSKAEPSVIRKWINATCQKYGVQALPSASQRIGDYCLFDMSRIDSEVRKLCDYVGFDGVIDDVVVDSMVTKDTEYKIYEMTDAIGKRKISDAITMVNEMLSKGETLQRLLVSLYNYFRRLLHIAISTKSVEELAELIGIKPFAVKKAKEQAKAFKVISLKKAVDILADTDFLTKSGKRDIDESFWLSLFKIMMEM